MKSFIEQAQCYADYHQKPITLYTHLVGVPLIVFSLMIFFGFIHVVVPGILDINLAGIGTILILFYYFLLNWRLALVVTPIFFFLLWIADLITFRGPTRFALWIFLITFISGWILQLFGHYREGRKPALLDNFYQVLIAPIYLVAELFFKAGWLMNLENQIHHNPIIPSTNSSKTTINQDENDGL